MATNHHDTGYKELFSYPEFVQQLIEGCAPAEIAQLMDFSTLKNHSGNYITPLFEEKFEDVVWSVEVTWQGVTQRVFLYILLEFQSSVDRTLPIRLMHYVACFYSELIKQEGHHPRPRATASVSGSALQRLEALDRQNRYLRHDHPGTAGLPAGLPTTLALLPD